MDIAKDARDGDQTTHYGDLDIFLTSDANALLANATIDYSDAQGFMITGTPGSSC